MAKKKGFKWNAAMFLLQTNSFSLQQNRCHVGLASLNLPLFGLGPLSKGLGTNLKLSTNKIA